MAVAQTVAAPRPNSANSWQPLSAGYMLPWAIAAPGAATARLDGLLGQLLALAMSIRGAHRVSIME